MNQRFAIVGPSTLATRPLPSPAQEPEEQGQLPDLARQAGGEQGPAVISRLSSATVADPERTISRRQIGPDRPKTSRPTAAASDRPLVDQPGSVVHRQQERPGRGAHAGRGDQDHRRDGDDDPAVEDRATHRRRVADALQPRGSCARDVSLVRARPRARAAADRSGGRSGDGGDRQQPRSRQDQAFDEEPRLRALREVREVEPDIARISPSAPGEDV